MEWLIVGLLVVVFFGYKILGRAKKPDLSMSAKDIGKIVDDIWDEWEDN